MNYSKISKQIQTWLLAVPCLMMLIGSAQAGLNLADGAASGQWYNPARDGEGFYVEVIGQGDNLQIAVAMYSYDENGKQLWLVGIAPIADGDQGAVVPVTLVDGPVWGTQYDPADRQVTEFGTIIVRFPNCDTAMFQVESNVQGLESGTYSLQRLTSLVGMDCTNPPPPASEDVATPGQWTGTDTCIFINTEPHYGYEPGNRLIESELCNGFALEADIPGVEVDIKGETGPACQVDIQCSGNWGINYPGENSFGWVWCSGLGADAEVYFTSPTQSTVVVYEYTGDEGTLCVGNVNATPAQ